MTLPMTAVDCHAHRIHSSSTQRNANWTFAYSTRIYQLTMTPKRAHSTTQAKPLTESIALAQMASPASSSSSPTGTMDDSSESSTVAEESGEPAEKHPSLYTRTMLFQPPRRPIAEQTINAAASGTIGSDVTRTIDTPTATNSDTGKQAEQTGSEANLSSQWASAATANTMSINGLNVGNGQQANVYIQTTRSDAPNDGQGPNLLPAATNHYRNQAKPLVQQTASQQHNGQEQHSNPNNNYNYNHTNGGLKRGTIVATATTSSARGRGSSSSSSTFQAHKTGSTSTMLPRQPSSAFHRANSLTQSSSDSAASSLAPPKLTLLSIKWLLSIFFQPSQSTCTLLQTLAHLMTQIFQSFNSIVLLIICITITATTASIRL